VPGVGQTVKYSRGVLEMEEKGVRALFVRSSRVPETSLTQVDLFLLPGQSTEVDLMLWHCDQPSSGLFSAFYTADNLPAFDTFDEVKVVCVEIPSRSRIRGQKGMSLILITLLRPWQEVVGDTVLKQQIATKEQVFLLSSLPTDRVEYLSWHTGTSVFMRVDGEETREVNMERRHVQLLHQELSSNDHIWRNFVAVHHLPFHILVTTRENNGFSVEAIKWDIDKYLSEHAVQVSSFDDVYRQNNVIIPQNTYKVTLFALVCPNQSKTEVQLKQALKDRAFDCCVLFPRKESRGDTEGESKRNKTGRNE
jgi:hypothetical protein